MILQDVLNEVDWHRQHQDVDFLRADLHGHTYFWPITEKASETMREVLASAEPFLNDGYYIADQDDGQRLYKELHHHPSGNCTYAYLMDGAGNEMLDTPGK